MIGLQIKNELVKIGLSNQECEAISNEDALQYLRFYSKKYWEKVSIAFIGFSDIEKATLLNKVDNASFKVYKTLSADLNFVCLSQKATEKQIKRVIQYSATVLSEADFLIIFSQHYTLGDNVLLYNLDVTKDFRIAKPLSNFNENVAVDSFSESNDNQYSANLYTMKCSCAEFASQNKSIFPLGDLRRLCKHLIHQYKNTVGVYGVSPLAKCVFDDGYGLLNKFRYFKIDTIPGDIVVNYDQDIGWWNLYVPNKQGDYTKYGYSPLEKRFSYNQKPIGIIPQLRRNLDLLEKELLGSSDKKGKGTTPDISSGGCLVSIGLLIAVGVILYIVL